MNDIESKVERIINAIEWLALHRTGDDSQQHNLLTALHGPEWGEQHPVFERNDGG